VLLSVQPLSADVGEGGAATPRVEGSADFAGAFLPPWALGLTPCESSPSCAADDGPEGRLVGKPSARPWQRWIATDPPRMEEPCLRHSGTFAARVGARATAVPRHWKTSRPAPSRRSSAG